MNRGGAIFPTAREIAVAIVTAARLHDDDPVLMLEGSLGTRGRWLAIAALASEFPLTPMYRIAELCGVSSTSAGVAKHSLKEKRRSQWWKDDGLKVVELALASAISETDADIRNRAGAIQAPVDIINDDPSESTDVFVPLLDSIEATADKVADFSHLREAPLTPRRRVIDHRVVGMVDLGDPALGRSALDRRGSP